MTIKIDKELFQWEQNREVFVDFDKDETQTYYIQFFNPKTQQSPLTQITEGRALIPNELLQFCLPITALICTETQVLARKEFKVLKRPKPEGYDNTLKELLELNKILGGGI